MSDGPYNGWTNYETWCASMWMDNDESNYRQARELASDADGDYYELADRLRDWMDDENPLADQASMWTDLLSGAFSVIDWEEIARGLIAEMDDQ